MVVSSNPVHLRHPDFGKIIQRCLRNRYAEVKLRSLLDRALPTELTAHKIKMAGLAGFEPAHHGVKVRCLTAWL